MDELRRHTAALRAELAAAAQDAITVNNAALNRLHTAADADAFSNGKAFAAAWQTLKDAFDPLYSVPQNLTALRQTILQLAVQGKLVPQDPNDEPATELITRIEAEKTRLYEEKQISKPARFSKITQDQVRYLLPMNWQWCYFGQVTDHRLGKMLDQHKNKGEFFPYLRNLNVQWQRIDLADVNEMRFEEHELDEYMLQSGDLLICEGGEPGRCAIWTRSDTLMMFQKAIHRARPFNGIHSKYLLYHLMCDARNGVLPEYFTGATIKHFTGQSLARYMIALPPLAEQERIVAKVDELLALCDVLEAELAEAEAVRVRLVDAVLAGV